MDEMTYYRAQVREAVILATFWHQGQKDCSGQPYVGHLQRVATYVGQMPGFRAGDLAIAWLHDIVKETPITIGDLKKKSFSDYVVEGVNILTRSREMTYAEYIESVVTSGHFGAVRVKYADLKDNSDSRRSAGSSPPLQRRYKKALRQVEELLETMSRVDKTL